MPVEMATRLYDEIVEAGADLGFRDAGMYALTALRIEVGYRAWGHDVTPDDTPLEAGLAFALKLKTDIPFKGRDALLAERAAGLKRRLVHIRFDDPDVFPLGDEPILREGRIVGQVTPAAYGHSLGTGVAMGYVACDGIPLKDLAAAGRYEIELADEPHAVEVSTAPFLDPKSPSNSK